MKRSMWFSHPSSEVHVRRVLADERCTLADIQKAIEAQAERIKQFDARLTTASLFAEMP